MIVIERIVLDTDKLDALANALGMKTDQVLNSIAYQVEAEAKILAPVDTGALKNSISTSKVGAGAYRVQDGMEYGIYQELGTSRMGAQPFMVPAVEKVRGYVEEQFSRLF